MLRLFFRSRNLKPSDSLMSRCGGRCSGAVHRLGEKQWDSHARATSQAACALGIPHESAEQTTATSGPACALGATSPATKSAAALLARLATQSGLADQHGEAASVSIRSPHTVSVAAARAGGSGCCRSGCPAGGTEPATGRWSAASSRPASGPWGGQALAERSGVGPPSAFPSLE